MNKNNTIVNTEKPQKTDIIFIIPSIGRDSLKQSLISLINQTYIYWKAIVIFDGCKKTDSLIIDDPRISYYEIEKSKGVINQASDVRNIGLEKLTQTIEWVAFLDDDDCLAPDYVEYFLNEMKSFHCDVFIYRMINKDLKIFPSLESKKIIPCDVGISFIVRDSVFKDIKFENSHCEDYDFLKKTFDAGFLITVSSQIKYFVKSNIDDYKNHQLEFENKYKIFLNGIHPLMYLFYFKYLDELKNRL